MKNKFRQIGEQHLINNLKKCKKKGAFDILNYISEKVTLVHSMVALGNVNRDISIVSYCIFDSNYEKALCLKK